MFTSVVFLFLYLTYAYSQDFKQGTCPIDTRAECPSLKGQHTCLVDPDCAGVEKCCQDSCGVYSCKKPDGPTSLCETGTDFAIILDSSSSMTSGDYLRFKSFIISLLYEYDVREGGTHVSIIVFGDNARLAFDFERIRGDLLSKSNIAKRIEKLPQISGSNRLDLALFMARREVFSVHGGTRRNAPRVLLIVTDGIGESNKNMKILKTMVDESKKLKENGVEIFVVATGDKVDLSNLAEVSSGAEKIFHLKDSSELTTTFRNVALRTCKTCSQPVDIGFAIPANSFAQFADLRDFVERTLNYFIVGNRNVQIGLIVYRSDAEVVIKFDQFHNLNKLKAFVQSIAYVNRGNKNNLESVLQVACNQLFTLRSGLRQHASKKLILVAEKPLSWSTHTVKKYKEQLKFLGVDIIGVAYGSDVNKQVVKDISSFPTDKNFKVSPSITNLLRQLPRTLGESACKGKQGKCPFNKNPKNCLSPMSHECRVDEDCLYNEKCCEINCARVCKTPVKGCFKPLEIAFLVDNSFYVSDEEMTRVKGFMKEMTTRFAISETAARFSIATYNWNARVLLQFNDNVNTEHVIEKINSLTKVRNQGRRLDLGLRLIESDVFSLKGGIRQGAPRVLIVLSGGPSSDNSETLKLLSSPLRAMASVWAVGGGPSSSKAYLNDIASNAKQSRKTLLFENLFPLVSEITNVVCSDKPGKCPGTTPFSACTDRDHECSSDFECPGFAKCCHDGCRRTCFPLTFECNRPLDLAIVMESSNNIGLKNFEMVKNFAKDLVKALNVDNSQTQIAIITYGDGVEPNLEFRSLKGIINKEINILRRIDRSYFSGGSNNAAHKALEHAYLTTFTEQQGSRKYAVKGLIFISDGQLRKNTKRIYDAATLLKQAGVAIYPVAASKNPNLEALEAIASHSSNEHVFLATSLPAIIQYVQQISTEACKAEAPPQEIQVVRGPKGVTGIRGRKGERGSPGASGQPGEQGAMGSHGGDGIPGPPGARGNPGRQGAPGKMYIQMTRRDRNGVMRTVSLPPIGKTGPQGSPGRPGKPGSQGSDGSPGPQGVTGVIGYRGYPGRRGEPGQRGAKGATGRHGRPGRRGRPGNRGKIGDIGPPGSSSAIGRKGANGYKGQPGLYGDPGTRGDTGLPGTQGGFGEKGKKGLPGQHGRKGLSGVAGIRGPKGPDGYLGSKGDHGNIGGVGIMGDRGKKGPPGPNGSPGLRGVPGETGSAGFSGENGEPGLDGNKGGIGKIGPKGSIGDPGPLGSSGIAGETAFQGEPGIDGPPGLKGKKGNQGLNGGIGTLGAKGIQGNTGVSGLDGNIGPNGKKGIEGDTGPLGPGGIEGQRGIQGSRGRDGREGVPGPQGKPGQRGKPGGIGKRGDNGQIGKIGKLGATGKQGSKGKTGPPGRDGKEGTMGVVGDNGRTGVMGEKGAQGRSGMKGKSGLKGTLGPQGKQGIVGPLGNKGEKGLKGIKGEIGEAGFPGRVGDIGFMGPAGDAGTPGEQGPPGDKGRTGYEGREGEKGPLGKAGMKGVEGLKGAFGAKGEPGLLGEEGKAGLPGVNGERGKRGVTGPPGPMGPTGTSGEPGVSGVEGYMGSLGPIGEKGEKGAIGVAGDSGPAGALGDNGINGPRGPRGLPGKRGEKGEDGIQGVVGDPGGIGAPGSKGLSGAPGPSGVPGIAGEMGLLGEKGKIGARGIKGLTGVVGSDGIQGYVGRPGFPGSTGFAGARGERGAPGMRGIDGPFGNPGYQGPMGRRGLPGAVGDPGAEGKEGPAGDPGDPGANGLNGIKGEPGIRGDAGEDGEVGMKGLKGFSGTPGPKGPFGHQGEVGALGHRGVAGVQGGLGIRGLPGKRGKIGAYGDPGPQGDPGINGGFGRPGIKGEAGEPGKKGNDGHEGFKGEVGSIGPKGTQGAPGERGMVGAPGRTGPKGDPGEKGDPGPTGFVGLTGPPGRRGWKGQTGMPGQQGKEGEKGIVGDPGPIGFMGTYGPRGKRGDKGKTGNIGLKGFSGEVGYVGAIGPPGDIGVEGFAGSLGLPGPDGDVGRKGSPGNRGPPGPPGPPGTSQDLSASRDNPRSFQTSDNAEPILRYYSSDKQFEIIKQFTEVNKEMALLLKPTGTKANPAVTCKNLFKDHPHFKSGNYWLDPNEGAPEDAVLVFCDSHQKQSCIFPLSSKTEMKQWFKGGDRYLWFKENINENFKFRYNMESGQLTFLQLFSDNVTQNLTYYCVKSIAWHDRNNKSLKSLKVLGDNEREYEANTARKHRPILLSDGCKFKDDRERKTIIKITTQNTARLPIRDVAVYDGGDEGELFALELGPVCFG